MIDNSMTKTLSSFKSLMLKTVSNMTNQHEQNLQTQYSNGLKFKEYGTLAGQQAHFKSPKQTINRTTSINISSIMGERTDTEFDTNA